MKKSNVILIDCEALPELRTDHYEYVLHTEPLGLEYLAAYLINNNHNVGILQLPLSEKDKKNIGSVDIVGLSALTYQWEELKRTAKLVRELNPKAIIVAGREHPTAIPEICLKEIPEINCVVCGEGEIPLLQIANGVEFSEVQGIVYRNGDKFISNPRPKRLTEWPRPIRDGKRLTVTLKEWQPITDKSAGIMISRGCPFNCMFCTKQEMWGSEYITQGINEVIDEIVNVQKKYGVSFFAFHDLAFPPTLIESFCKEIINRKIKAQFFTMMSITPQSINWTLVREAGFVEIGVGLEIPSDQRQEIGKVHSFQVAKNFINSMTAAGIMVRLYLVIGWPHEKDIDSVIDFYKNALREIPAHFIRAHFLIPFPGTKIWEKYKENFIYSIPSGFKHFTTMEPVLKFDIEPEKLKKMRRKILDNYYNSDYFKNLYKDLNNNQKNMIDAFLTLRS